MTQDRWASFSGEQLASACALEADAFTAIAMTPCFDSLIRQFEHYDSYLKTLNKDSKHRKIVRSLMKNDGISDTAVPTRELAQLFCLAQIAACSELFKGWKINLTHLNREGMRALIDQGCADIRNIQEISPEIRPEQYSEAQRQLLNGVNIIQNVETVRVLQVVKLLGLISTRLVKFSSYLSGLVMGIVISMEFMVCLVSVRNRKGTPPYSILIRWTNKQRTRYWSIVTQTITITLRH